MVIVVPIPPEAGAIVLIAGMMEYGSAFVDNPPALTVTATAPAGRLGVIATIIALLQLRTLAAGMFPN
jgi:hypothetical protein